MDELSWSDWYQYGLDNGFIGPPVCITHDGAPTSAEEDEEIDAGDDICIFMIRPYADDEQRAKIEENHPPSMWRR